MFQMMGVGGAEHFGYPSLVLAYTYQDLCDLWVMGIYGDSNQQY